MPDRPDFSDLIGKPFCDGGRGPDAFDCWGLAREVYRRFGIDLPDYRISALAAEEIHDQIDRSRPEWRPCSPPYPVPALVVFRLNSYLCNHVGVLIDPGRFLHVAARRNVCIERLDSPLWRRLVAGVYVPGWLE